MVMFKAAPAAVAIDLDCERCGHPAQRRSRNPLLRAAWRVRPPQGCRSWGYWDDEHRCPCDHPMHGLRN